MALAVLLTPTSFGIVVGVIVALLILVSLMYRHPTRRCHRCGNKVRLTQRVCGRCGYDFAPIRTTR